MFGLSSVLAEIRRSEGSIRLERKEPLEQPPWADGPDGQPATQPPSRRFKVRLNPLTQEQMERKNATTKNYLRPLVVPLPPKHVEYRQLDIDDHLNARKAEIRLLRLLPGAKEDLLRCEIIHARLADPPEFDALSYCWGDPNPTAELACDGTTAQITASLAAALRALRRGNAPRVLWVDALCVNQADLDEKQHQVPMMGKIYRAASAVQIWLGNDTPEGTIAASFSILTSLKDLCVRFGWDIDFTYLVRARLLGEYGLPDVDADTWRSVRYLVELPWFSRTWIIQEAMLARRAQLHCDGASLPWGDFCVGFLALSQAFLSLRLDVVPSVSSYAQTMQLILSSHKAGAPARELELSALLENHRAARATDAKDKIYGFLGLHELTGRGNHSIVPDYRRSDADVFTEVAARFVAQSPTLDLLGVPRPDFPEGIVNLASWVPDWSAYEFASSLSCRSVSGTYLFSFDAAKTATVSKHAVVTGRTLQLSGYPFDTIAKTGFLSDPYLRPADSGHVRMSPAASVLHSIALNMDWILLSGGLSSKTYPTGEDPLDAFTRTLYLDHLGPTYTLQQAAEYYRRLYAPFHALRAPWTGEGRMRVMQRAAFLQTSVLGRLVGPRAIRGVARLTEKLEAVMPVYGVYNLGKQPKGPRATSELVVDARTRSLHRRMVRTERGYIGLGPRGAREGDRVFLVKGCRTPLVLRPRGEVEEEWELVGDCYVHGIMRGEAFEEGRCQAFVVV